MIIFLTDTATGKRVEIELPYSQALAGSAQDVAASGCSLTVTHTPGKLSHFAIVDVAPDGTRTDFDFELFNYEPEYPQAAPYYLASLLRRFTAERLASWRARHSPAVGDVLLESPLGTQQLACGNRVPVENPTTIRVQ